MRWVYVPTTLLAMADSCIGGKTSLNVGAHKNLIGTMYPPHRLLVHPGFVATLTEADYLSGLGEVAKLALLGGNEELAAFRKLLPRLLKRDLDAVELSIKTSLLTKKAYIEADEFDEGRRNLLNFGHCFGHALETATTFALPHGQAVVLGMILADWVACSRGLLDASEEARLRREVLLPLLPSCPELSEDARRSVVQAMEYDKKRTGHGLALVMMTDGLVPVRVADLTVEEAIRRGRRSCHRCVSGSQ